MSAVIYWILCLWLARAADAAAAAEHTIAVAAHDSRDWFAAFARERDADTRLRWSAAEVAVWCESVSV